MVRATACVARCRHLPLHASHPSAIHQLRLPSIHSSPFYNQNCLYLLLPPMKRPLQRGKHDAAAGQRRRSRVQAWGCVALLLASFVRQQYPVLDAELESPGTPKRWDTNVITRRERRGRSPTFSAAAGAAFVDRAFARRPPTASPRLGLRLGRLGLGRMGAPPGEATSPQVNSQPPGAARDWAASLVGSGGSAADAGRDRVDCPPATTLPLHSMPRCRASAPTGFIAVSPRRRSTRSGRGWGHRLARPVGRQPRQA